MFLFFEWFTSNGKELSCSSCIQRSRDKLNNKHFILNSLVINLGSNTVEPLISDLGITDLVNHKFFPLKSVLYSITDLENSPKRSSSWDSDLDCGRRRLTR